VNTIVGNKNLQIPLREYQNNKEGRPGFTPVMITPLCIEKKDFRHKGWLYWIAEFNTGQK